MTGTARGVLVAVLLIAAAFVAVYFSRSGRRETPSEEGGPVAEQVFTFPAEWEPHESIWMGWPPQEYVKRRPASAVQMEMIRALAGHVKVDLAVQDAAEADKVKRIFRERDLPHDHVRFHDLPHTDIWFRDMGPLFVKRPGGSLRVIDLKFNLWGTDPSDTQAGADDAVDRLVAKELGLASVRSDLVLEGGALEFNGRGTVLTTEAVVHDRNPTMPLGDVERELKRLFGVRKVVWVRQGLAEDDSPLNGVLPGRVFTLGTNGHVDEFARFVDARTILLAEVTAEEAKADPIARISRDRLEAAREALAEATDQDGEPFRILRVPAADGIINAVKPGDYVYDELLAKNEYKDGTKFPKGQPVRVAAATSYLNFLVTNGVVLMAKYWKPGRPESVRAKDEAARRILAEAFPGRKIVQLDAENVNLGGGGMHCITQQQPRKGGGQNEATILDPDAIEIVRSPDQTALEGYHRLLRATFSPDEVEPLARMCAEISGVHDPDAAARYLCLVLRAPKERDRIAAGVYASLHADVLALRFLVTQPEYRNLGIGRGLLRRLLAEVGAGTALTIFGECVTSSEAFFNRELGMRRLYVPADGADLLREVHYEIPHLGEWGRDGRQLRPVAQPRLEHLQLAAGSEGRVAFAEVERIVTGVWRRWYVRSPEEFDGRAAWQRHFDRVMRDTLEARILAPLRPYRELLLLSREEREGGV